MKAVLPISPRSSSGGATCRPKGRGGAWSPGSPLKERAAVAAADPAFAGSTFPRSEDDNLPIALDW